MSKDQNVTRLIRSEKAYLAIRKMEIGGDLRLLGNKIDTSGNEKEWGRGEGARVGGVSTGRRIMRQGEETNATIQHGSETHATRRDTARSAVLQPEAARSAVLRLHKRINNTGRHQKETDHDVDLKERNVQLQQILRVC